MTSRTAGAVAREAILLVGGQGTRLRPLTETVPKPMLRVAGVPLTVHQIARAREAGVERIILATSYRAEVFAAGIGDGAGLGVAVCHAYEEEPLGTGGAIRHAAAQLRCGPQEPVLIFNGDVLTGVDIGATVAAWQAAAADVALYLTRVPDPRAYGLVPTDAQGWVSAFVEKPTTPEQVITNQVNAGMYVFRRDLIEEIPAGRVVSVERETFPGLLAAGCRVRGVVDPGYWRDLGTPAAFVAGSADLVRGIAPTPALPGPTGPALVLPGAEVQAGATLTGGTVVESAAVIGAGAVIEGCVIAAGARIGPGARLRATAVGEFAVVGRDARIVDSVLAERAVVAAGADLLDARLWPGRSEPGEPAAT